MTVESIIAISVIALVFDDKVINSINKYASAIKSWFNKESK